MSNLINIVLIVLVFGSCIMIHEFGHFITAKKSGVQVNEFAIGMGPKLFGRKKGETLYSLRLLPIGGYCAMLGEDESSEDPRAFCNVPVANRILIVIAGALFNFILAFVLSLVLISFIGVNTNEITMVSEDGAAQEAGLQTGDCITHINGSRIYNFREISVFMQFYQSDEPVTMELVRDGKQLTLSVQPKKLESGVYQLGIAGGYQKATGPLQVIAYSALEVRYWIKTTFVSLKQLFVGRVGIQDLSGPVGIGSAMNDVIVEAKKSGDAINVFLNIINFAILLTANLGVMNLLPLPALDGGRFVFLLWEALTKKRVPENAEAMVHGIGMVLLLGLMAVVMFQDIIKLMH